QNTQAAFGSLGFCLMITDCSGAAPHNEDGNPPPGSFNQISSGSIIETQPNGFQLIYDSSGSLARMQTRAHGSNRPICTVNQSSRSIPSLVIDPLGRRLSYTYDVDGRIRRITDVYSRITTFSTEPPPPDAATYNVTGITLPDGRQTTFKYLETIAS